MVLNNQMEIKVFIGNQYVVCDRMMCGCCFRFNKELGIKKQHKIILNE